MQNVEAPKNAIERAMLKHDVKQAELGNSKSATESFPQSPYNENAMNMTYQEVPLLNSLDNEEFKDEPVKARMT